MSEDSSYPIDYSTEPRDTFEWTPVEADGVGLCPAEYRSQLAIDTVHDGQVIPAELLASPRVQPLRDEGLLWKHFVIERDWGANVVASYLSKALGLSGFSHVTPARVVMDFNRFPGSSSPDATPLDRLAIIHPLARVLDHREKRAILRHSYDTISEEMEASIRGKLIKISVHTYDAYNPSRTERPEVSLITRALSYQMHSKLPLGLFDPLFPDVLTESTCNSILRDRLSITLEKAGITVEHNYPYCAPDGSLEVRTQPWFYFQHVRDQFEDVHPETRDHPAFLRVWRMLLNTNLRDGDAEALRGFLHRFRGIPRGLEDPFENAMRAYEQIAEFITSNPDLVRNYRSAATRLSALSIEVRKDLVFEFDGDEPVGPKREAAKAIAEIAAEGIAIYLRHDLPEILERSGSLHISSPPIGCDRGDTGL